MPAEKVVEQRRQTRQKLELMERYWGAWCMILAQARRYWFCPTRLWLVDTHAGSGSHASTTDPDGKIEGTPALAALKAREVQRRFPDVEIRVRATDKDKATAALLLAAMRPYKGTPPDGVNLEVGNVDWTKAVPWVAAEIAQEDHPHGGRPIRGGSHGHKSLWFIDPYGVESLDHSVIESLPSGAEVIVNLDLMALLRHAGKAAGDRPTEALLAKVFDGTSWKAAANQPSPHKALADAYADSFPRWPHRNAYLLRVSGSQDRAMVHLTDSPKAVTAFRKEIETSLRAGTLAAGGALTTIQRDQAAVDLFGQFRGFTLTTREMAAVLPRFNLTQLRTICRTADANRYGRWDEKAGAMEWFAERSREPGLFD